MFKKLIVVTALAIATQAALALDYPKKPITVVVPFPAGGPTDLSARLMTKVMGDLLGQPFVIDNRAGAGGTVGTGYVARANPDGYTLLWGGTSSLVVAPALYNNLIYDPVQSFHPIGMAVRSPLMLAGRADLKAADLKAVIAESKIRKVTYGSAGNGSIGHFAGELLKSNAKIELMHIPYKGGAPALNDLLGGQIDLIFDTGPFLLPHVTAGKLRAYAVTGTNHFDPLPNVPTMMEATGKDYEAYSWFGLMAPAKTPDDIVRRLSEALAKATQDPAIRKQVNAAGQEVVGNTSAQFSQIIVTDLARWKSVAQQAVIRPE